MNDQCGASKFKSERPGKHKLDHADSHGKFCASDQRSAQEGERKMNEANVEVNDYLYHTANANTWRNFVRHTSNPSRWPISTQRADERLTYA